MSEVNFGFTLEKGEVSVGEITKITLPEYGQGKVQKTNHGSPQFREYIPDGLIGVEDFTATITLTPATLYGLKQDMLAKTISEYTVGVPGDIDPWVFDGFPTKVKPGEADAMNPGLLEAEVTFSPTGVVDMGDGDSSS